MAKIPATVITGFLGAGKTTLVRSLIEQADGRRIALIVNEFGDVGIDGGLLRGCGVEGCRDEDVIELANGCICCTVADDFIPVMERLLAQTPPPDHIVIETSGLALPQPLVRAFNWPEVRHAVTVDGVITVVDAPAVADGGFAHDEAAVLAQREADPTIGHDDPIHELFEDQLACADLVVLSKADLLDGEALARVRTEVEKEVRDGIPVIEVAHGRIGIDVLLGMGLAAENDMGNRPTHHEREGFEDHDHDDFESIVIDIPGTGPADDLLIRVERACRVPDILRIKGFADLGSSDMRYVVQAVGHRVQGHFDRDWLDGETRASRLVVIGARGFDRERVTRLLGG
ncbi:MAG: cobalamin biosynthesis protein CobW [Geminicoccaceae bacterium]|nr:cobalamin biosynthesis protein CobW [Geminicoccaceae bacterium]